MNRAGDFSSVDLKSLMDQIETLNTRAEAAEMAVKDLRSNTSNGTHSTPLALMPPPKEDPSPNSTVVALKESILRLDAEKVDLEKTLQQRDKKIELLEENLRGPVPYEMGR
jgi:predicted  nucleic acid-binding Zn-ribbon protein